MSSHSGSALRAQLVPCPACSCPACSPAWLKLLLRPADAGQTQTQPSWPWNLQPSPQACPCTPSGSGRALSMLPTLMRWPLAGTSPGRCLQSTLWPRSSAAPRRIRQQMGAAPADPPPASAGQSVLCAQGAPPAEGDYPQDPLLADVSAAEGKAPSSLAPSLVSGAGQHGVPMNELTKVRTACHAGASLGTSASGSDRTAAPEGLGMTPGSHCTLCHAARWGSLQASGCEAGFSRAAEEEQVLWSALAAPPATGPCRQAGTACRPSGRCRMLTLTLPGVLQVATMFVGCQRGVSHSPAEHVSQADVAVATKALFLFLQAHQRQQRWQLAAAASSAQPDGEL